MDVMYPSSLVPLARQRRALIEIAAVVGLELGVPPARVPGLVAETDIAVPRPC